MYAPHQEPVAFPRRGGFVVGFHPDTVNYCPACSRSHWLVGRLSAQCAFCDTALPIVARAKAYDWAEARAA